MPIFYIECKKHHNTITFTLDKKGVKKGVVYSIWDRDAAVPHKVNFTIRDIRVEPYDRLIVGTTGVFLGAICASVFGNPLIILFGSSLGLFGFLAWNEGRAVKAREKLWALDE